MTTNDFGFAPYEVRPIAVVESTRTTATDDNWDSEESTIVLDSAFPDEALMGLEEFSHLDIVYLFHKVPADQIETVARRPRGNRAWPRVGIFAQRGKNRPNRLGLTSCTLLGVDKRRLIVRGLDAIDGTPVLDIKPHMMEFEARGPIRQPVWSTELMREYWSLEE